MSEAERLARIEDKLDTALQWQADNAAMLVRDVKELRTVVFTGDGEKPGLVAAVQSLSEGCAARHAPNLVQRLATGAITRLVETGAVALVGWLVWMYATHRK